MVEHYSTVKVVLRHAKRVPKRSVLINDGSNAWRKGFRRGEENAIYILRFVVGQPK